MISREVVDQKETEDVGEDFEDTWNYIDSIISPKPGAFFCKDINSLLDKCQKVEESHDDYFEDLLYVSF